MNSGVQNSAGLSVIACTGTGTKMEQTSLVPRPTPSFCHLQYEKQKLGVEGWERG